MNNAEVQDHDAMKPGATDAGDSASGTEPVVGADATAAATDAQVLDTAVQLTELQMRVESLEDTLLRAKAENQNALRRATTERIEAVRYAHADLMRAIIPGLDDLERAIAAADQRGACKVAKPSGERAAAGADAVLLSGVRLVFENLLQALRGQGLEVIAALHQPFDPHLHEAMMRQPSDDHPAGTVLQELAKGYRLHERTLRPAKVIVAQAVEKAE